MKCKVCGAESGKYTLCRFCNSQKEKGLIIKCKQCNNWHYINAPCPEVSPVNANSNFLYDVRKKLISKTEQDFFNAIKKSVPEGYFVFPQINLASFIDRTDDSRFHNELFRNVDFLITDPLYVPKIIVEINDLTHMTNERRERDEKVQKICEEAGIPIIKLWTSYGINISYIKGRIDETLNNLPVARVHHFSQAPQPQIQQNQSDTDAIQTPSGKNGCYIATCVYGSYDCPEVWVLRRYRDQKLVKTWYGRAFVRFYYAISPTIVKLFGRTKWFNKLFRSKLNGFIVKLQKEGINEKPYKDIEW